MSEFESDSTDTRSSTDVKRLASILVRGALGVVFLAGAVYAFRNPIVSTEAGLFGIGFYPLLAVALGVVTLYTAYRKTTVAPEDGLVGTY